MRGRVTQRKAEALGLAGYEFIEYHPQEFASYFDNRGCFTHNDLAAWADIVLMEFSLREEITENHLKLHVFCFIDKHLFKKSEIYNFQLPFQSDLNFLTGGGNRDKVLINFIEKENNTIPVQDRDDQLGFYMRHTDWCLVKEYKSHASEIVDFLNHKVQESKLS